MHAPGLFDVGEILVWGVPMRLLFLGDVFGKSGRSAIAAILPGLRESWSIDCVVANCENATQGRGVTTAHARDLLASGIDCMTLGDHAFDQRELQGTIEQMPIVRPLNYARQVAGRGWGLCETPKGTVLVIAALGQVFMRAYFDSALPMIEDLLARYPLGRAVAAIVLDFHCEATSEKVATGYIHDGRVTIVAGTHTHIPTADARILSRGTAYMTDVGMSGTYDSVIGLESEPIVDRFLRGMPKGRMDAARGPATLCGLLVDSDDQTGLATRIRPVRIGGILGDDPPKGPEDPFVTSGG